jgi:pimeloyl-ACP methyl ester carboxylesterase
MKLNYQIINPKQERTVVFLHGFLESLSMWRLLDLESMPFRSILIDLPGHGNSELVVESKQEERIVLIAKKINSFLFELGIKTFDIVGHSLGGYIAIELHKQIQNNKNKIVLLHSNFWEDEFQKKEDRNRVIEVVRKNKSFFIKEAIPNLFLEDFKNSEFVKELIKEALLIDALSIIYYSEAMRDRLSNESYFSENLTSFFVVQGENDKIVPKEKMKSFPIINFTEIKNAGHMGHFENQKDIEKFLRIF